jgi:hypothetical protein
MLMNLTRLHKANLLDVRCISKEQSVRKDRTKERERAYAVPGAAGAKMNVLSNERIPFDGSVRQELFMSTHLLYNGKASMNKEGTYIQ